MFEPTRIPPSTPCPAEPPRSYIRFLAVHPERTYRVAIASPRIWACLTHWTDRRTQWCPADLGDCPYCREGIPQRWTAFLVVYQRLGGFPALFDFYCSAYQACPQLAHHDGQLQRQIISVRRLGNRVNAPLDIHWDGVALEGQLTPVEHQAVYLSRLWGRDLCPREVR